MKRNKGEVIQQIERMERKDKTIREATTTKDVANRSIGLNDFNVRGLGR